MNFDLGHINKIAAVSVKKNGDKEEYNYLILKMKKGEIEIVKGERFVPDLKTLIKKITNRIPIVLHIEGKGILNRAVPNKENYRHALLMNAKLSDFYFSDYLEKETVYSSVIRRNAVNEILSAFEEKNVEVISFATGPFLCAPLIELTSKSNITVDNTRIDFDENRIQGFNKDEKNTSDNFIGDDQVHHDMMGALGVGIQFFTSNESIILPEEPNVYELNLKEAKQKNIFYRFAVGMVMFFLIILTGNFLYLEYLNSRIESNYMTLAEFEDQLAELNTLEEEKNRKETLLRGSGLLSKSFISFYLMEICNSVPTNVTLDQVSLRPLMDEIKSRHKIEFNDQLIMVTGKSKSSEILSNWIDRLKEKEWLASVDILDYTYKKNVGNFELEILLK